MPRRLIGRDYITVLRPTGEKDRHGDPAPFTRHREGPCMIDRNPSATALKEVQNLYIEGNRREMQLIFRYVPDVQATDEVELADGRRYRVVAVDRNDWASRGGLAGIVVRIAGLEEGA